MGYRYHDFNKDGRIDLLEAATRNRDISLQVDRLNKLKEKQEQERKAQELVRRQAAIQRANNKEKQEPREETSASNTDTTGTRNLVIFFTLLIASIIIMIASNFVEVPIWLGIIASLFVLGTILLVIIVGIIS